MRQSHVIISGLPVIGPSAVWVRTCVDTRPIIDPLGMLVILGSAAKAKPLTSASSSLAAWAPATVWASSRRDAACSRAFSVWLHASSFAQKAFASSSVTGRSVIVVS